MRLEGRFYCPRCMGVQDFILAEGASPQEPEPDLECYACGWVAGKYQVDLGPGRSIMKPWFTLAQRAAGRARAHRGP